jgi:hypothetical protein
MMASINRCDKDECFQVATATMPHPKGDRRLCSAHYFKFVGSGGFAIAEGEKESEAAERQKEILWARHRRLRGSDELKYHPGAVEV